MKKVLSLVLAFAMILGSFSFVFASNFSDVKDTEYYSEPVSVLSGLGVIAGYPDGTFGPNRKVTRAEMATMIVAALGINVSGQADTKFSDVPRSHWASGYINYATSVGFVAGFPDGSFKPNDEVTYDQALTMIVAAEGYKAESLPGTWPGSFVNKARSLGILDICRTTGTTAAPRKDIACYLYKALTNLLGYTDKDGAFHANLDGEGYADDTMLTRLGAHVLKGANGKDLFFVIEGNEDSVINLKNYMGAYASVYINDDGDIVAIKEVKSVFIEGKVDDLKDDYKFDNATQAASSIYKSFKNGEVDGTDVAYDSLSESVKLAVKLSSTGKSVSEVYSMQVWSNGQTFMADEDVQDSINGKTPKINGAKFALDEDDKIDTTSFALNGVGALSAIKKSDVVTVYKNKAGEVARIDVSNKTVVGVISKIKGDSYTIGGNAYGLNASAQTDASALEKLMNDKTEAEFFLDYAGDIYDVDSESLDTNYAVVLAFAVENGSWSDDSATKKVRLFLADGTAKEFTAGGDFAKTISESKTSSVCKVGDLVEYTLNSKDQVIKVATGAAAADLKFDKNGVCNGNALKDSTVVFNYSGDAEGLAKKDNYSVLKAADLFGKDANASVLASKGNYTAVLANKFTATSEAYGFFVKDQGKNADGKLYTALYDGAVKELTAETSVSVSLFTSGTAVAYKLTFDGEKVSGAAKASLFSKTFNGNAKGTVSGNVYKYDNYNYSMDADVVVYIKDGSSWSVGKLSDLAKSAEYFSSIQLFAQKDGDPYEIVLAIVR